MKKVIGVQVDAAVEWHVPSVGAGDYDTLCGMDASDPTIGHHGVVVPPVKKNVTCASCRQIWRGVVALRLRARDFA
ncbi:MULTISPECIES: hypothetical protein [Cupriavidus]